MKKFILITISIFLLNSFGYGFSKLDLIELNSYWKNHDLDRSYFKVLKKQNYTKIQIHLLLVEKSLRTDIINQSRNQLLSELRKYALKGVFPINNHHAKRMPYFIDDYGTACAVGQLIIKSGHDKLAKRISKESNYQYIREMDYPEIGSWAKEFGFTMEELMWIQPSYGSFCSVGSINDPDCHDGKGCINPDFQGMGLIPPYSFYSEYNSGTGWVVDSFNLWQMWGANIGQHRITVTDSNNTTTTLNYIINNVPEIQIIPTIINSNSAVSCNGQANFVINHNRGILNYFLTRNNPINTYYSNNLQFDSLCPGFYGLVIYDSAYCQSQKTIEIKLSTNILENELNRLNVFPNPFSNFIQINLIQASSIRIFNITGELLLIKKNFNQSTFNTSTLPKGIYILEVSNSNGTTRKKIIKSN